VSAAVRGLLVVAAASAAFAARAQEAQQAQDAPAEEDITLEEAVVTGSRIARSGYDQPTPVTVIGEEDLAQAGTPNISDFINELPAVMGSAQPSTGNRSLSGGTAGVNSVNLRSMGDSRTLVLLDGHRNVGSLANGTVDTNTMPQGLIKNIEIVTGGASATYGSDAVTGVVNFILDRTYTGVKVNLERGETGYGDDRNYLMSLTAGTPLLGGRGHVLFNADYSHRAGIYGMGNRDWADNGYYLAYNPAWTASNGQPEYMPTYNAGYITMTPGGIITNTALRGTYFGVGGSVKQFNYGAVRSPWTIGGDWKEGLSNQRTSLEPENRRKGLYSRLSYDIAENFNVFAEASWFRSRAQQWGGVQSDKASITMQSDNAFIPASVRTQLQTLGITSFTMGSSNADIPTRESDNTRTVKRGVLGFEGNADLIGSNWKYDGYYQFGRTDASESLYAANNARLALAQDAVRNPANTAQIICRSTITSPANGCVPFNRFGIGVNAPGAYDYFMGRPARDQRFEQSVAAVNATTNFANPWLDAIGFATGLEFREESISGVVDPQYNTGWVVGNFLPTFGRYHVLEGYVETLVPLPWKFEFNGAARLTDYSTSGTVTTWKTGLTWQPIEDVRLRGTLSRDIRAPGLQELFEAGRRNSNSTTDPWNAGGSRRYTQDLSGNPNLKPEKADTLGLGVVYRPSFVRGLGLSLDYYDIEINGAISSMTIDDVIKRCYEGGGLPGNTSVPFCDRVELRPYNNTQEFWIYNAPFNFVQQKARGLDFEASYGFDLASLSDSLLGEVSLRGLATHYLEMSSNDGVNAPIDRAGQNTSGGPPDWLYRLTAGYQFDRFNFSLTGRGVSAGVYDNSYIECTSGCPASTATNRTITDNHIPGAFYLDAYFGYNLPLFGTESQFFFKITNLQNKDPVPVGLGPTDSSNVEPGINRGIYDYLGRTFRVGVKIEL
jgi:outer membrane receptor protein involved in Fe transport